MLSHAGHHKLLVSSVVAGSALLLANIQPVAAADLQRIELGDFELESGDVIEGAFLTYVTHGELNEEKNNAILVLPSLMANHTRHDFLIGEGLALDPDEYFIIAANTLGNGHAISPSNSDSQPGMAFPEFSIRDMVNAQHVLVADELELEELFSVVGLSMGGMQTYEWAASYPEMTKSIVPIISMARTTGWVTAIWETQRQAIMADQSWQDGEYDEQPEGFRAAIGSLMVWVRHWDWMDEEFKDDNTAAIDWLHTQEENLISSWDANNYIYQTRAEDLHNIADAPGMNGDYETSLSTLSMPALIMPGKKDILHPPNDSRLVAEHMPNAHLSEIDSNLGHLGGGGVLEEDIDFVNAEITAFFERMRE
ncbi:MAG: alpha/beta fold hydrolase [Halomonas sp.]|nr:alpha/beta fold hydrolase [Halomonas sp.]TVP45301.1 MAG: alpha/beta fold hydrolase [Halomonas sp.]